MRSKFVFTAILVFSATACWTMEAQTASVGGAPALGYIFDTSVGAFRRIFGIPRAASVGEPFESGFSMQSAIVLGGSSTALAMSREGAAAVIDLSGQRPPALVPIVGKARALYSSPRGTAAAVLTEDWAGLLTGMNSGNLQVAGLVLNAQPIAASVSDDGLYLMAALQDGSILMAGRDGSRNPIAPPAPVSQVVFRPGGADALATTADSRVWLIQSGVLTQIAGPEDGVLQPVGLGFLPDGNRAVVASSNGVVLTVDVRSGVKSSASCLCKATQLEPMTAPGVFRLTEALGQPQYMFDGSSLQTFFVPAAASRGIREARPREPGRGPEE
ncbi:MAG TPA: hypothetical protein VKV74_16260 [Bryobacteraceae bacterium]|nr:hypothetical protein [Bryobacteraceae bacterium]